MKSYEFGYDGEQFNKICRLAKALTGIEIDDSKIDMVYSRLVRIIRSSTYKSFVDYTEALGRADNQLNTEFINAITTNLTSFFRERHHFDMLQSIALPELMEKKKLEKHIRVWSAGCSSGEEPYSIAFTLADYFRSKPGWTYQIYASDIDTNVLEKARRGVYDLDAVKIMNKDQLTRWFQKGVDVNEGYCRVKQEYRDSIDFFQCNLMQPLSFDTIFDVVFCRNVLIYFDPVNQKAILDQFMKHLTPEGFLITGHSESFMYRYQNTKLVAKTMYRKNV